MNSTKKSLKQFARKIGISIKLGKETRPLDFTNKPGITPIEASYLAEGRPYFIQVPMEKLVHLGYMAFPLTPDSTSPFIQTLLRYKEGKLSQYEGSPLEHYYTHFQPKSAAEILGIESTLLAHYPPHAAPPLWSAKSLRKTMRQTKKWVEADNLEHNEGDIKFSEGHTYFGPCTASKGKLELNRLLKIFNKIKELGYQTDWTGTNAIGGYCLYNNISDDWKILITPGQHRIAALLALENSSANIMVHANNKFNGVLNRKDVSHWPIVKKGTLTPQQALQVFDRISCGIQPNLI